MKGLFFDFEGIDGSGKGTLIQMLTDRLTGMGSTVVPAKEPGGTELGLKIRHLLFHDPTTHKMAPNVCDCLFLADHIQNVETVVKPALERGDYIISDRYAFSQFAYSVDREVEPLLGAAYRKLLGPVPDVIYLLMGTPEHLLARAQGRKVESHQDGKQWNNADAQRRIQEEYFRLLVPLKQTVIVDTDVLAPEELFNLYIWPAAEKAIRAASPEPIRVDWDITRPSGTETSAVQ